LILHSLEVVFMGDFLPQRVRSRFAVDQSRSCPQASLQTRAIEGSIQALLIASTGVRMSAGETARPGQVAPFSVFGRIDLPQ
jgi:hypothetical protein